VGEPARGYTREPFAPGHEKSTKHGAYSPRRWKPLADRLAAELLTERPWLADHTRTVTALARTEARIELIAAWLDEHGDLDEHGIPRPAGDQLGKLEGLALKLRTELALSPLALARLIGALSSSAAAASTPDGLEQIMRLGRAFVDAHEQRALAAAQDSAGSGAQPPPEPLNGFGAVVDTGRAAEANAAAAAMRAALPANQPRQESQ